MRSFCGCIGSVANLGQVIKAWLQDSITYWETMHKDSAFVMLGVCLLEALLNCVTQCGVLALSLEDVTCLLKNKHHYSLFFFFYCTSLPLLFLFIFAFLCLDLQKQSWIFNCTIWMVSKVRHQSARLSFLQTLSLLICDTHNLSLWSVWIWAGEESIRDSGEELGPLTN